MHCIGNITGLLFSTFSSPNKLSTCFTRCFEFLADKMIHTIFILIDSNLIRSMIESNYTDVSDDGIDVTRHIYIAGNLFLI